jgi:hypothetical protein
VHAVAPYVVEPQLQQRDERRQRHGAGRDDVTAMR